MGKRSGQMLRVIQVIRVSRERRESKRAPCRQVCPFKLMKFVGKSTVKLTKGFGHAINKSVKGMLLLLPVPLNRRQVFEIQVPSEAKKTPSTKLMEVCWARPILMSNRVKMYLAGTRCLFELPTPHQLPQAR